VIASMKQRFHIDLLRFLARENNKIIALWKEIIVLVTVYGVSLALSLCESGNTSLIVGETSSRCRRR
jgi:hypothetical protein